MRRYRFLAGQLSFLLLISTGFLSVPVVSAAGVPDLVIRKNTGGVTSVPLDGVIRYEIVVRNAGGATATGVLVRDPNIDPQLEYVTGSLVTSPTRKCRLTRINLVCDVNRLFPDQVFRVSFEMRAVVAACPRVRNQSNVVADNEPSTKTANNHTPILLVSITGCPPDTEAPTGSVSINAGALYAWGPKVQLNLSSLDNWTGPKFMRMRISNSPDTAGGVLTNGVTMPYVPARGWTLTGGTVPGSKTVYAQFQDQADNWSQVYQDSITMRMDAANTCTDARLRTARLANAWYTEQIYPYRDADWFKFQLSARRSVTFMLANLPLNYKLQIFNGSCGFLQVSDHSGRQSEAITRTLNAGTYFARVGPSASSSFTTRTYIVRMRLN